MKCSQDDENDLEICYCEKNMFGSYDFVVV